MPTSHRIGILTGGGDVPGLNSVIKSVVYRSTELGFDVLGLRRGWESLTHMRPGPEPDQDYVRPLDRVNTRTIDRTGGTALHSSRTNPKRMRAGNLPAFVGSDRLAALQTGDGIYDFTPIVLENLERLGIDTLISIGGDDTLSYSKVLADAGVREHLRVRERVVPADRDQRVDAQALQVLEHDRREVVDPVARLERREPVGADEGGQVPGPHALRVRPRRVERGPARPVDRPGVHAVEGADVVLVRLGARPHVRQRLPAAAQPEHVEPELGGPVDDALDDGVEAGDVTPAREDSDAVRGGHGKSGLLA